MKTTPTPHPITSMPSDACPSPVLAAHGEPTHRLDRGPGTAPTVRIPASSSDWRRAEILLRDYAAWIATAVGTDLTEVQPDFLDELTGLANAYRFPAGSFLVADDGLTICGVVAIRRHGDGSAELKRLYVQPAARGAGLADQLVAQAIRTATMLGASRLWLETLPGLMDPAIALYRRHGFGTAEIQPTIGVDGVIVMERDLRG